MFEQDLAVNNPQGLICHKKKTSCTLLFHTLNIFVSLFISVHNAL